MTGFAVTRAAAVAAIPLLVLMLAGTSQALSNNEWDATTCILSYSNPAIYKDGYSIRVVDFDGYGAVQVNISHDGAVIGSAVLKNNDTDWFGVDNGKIEIKGLKITDRTELSGPGRWPDDPKAELTIRIRKDQTPPAITIELDVDGKEYLLDDTVTVSITVKNIGETTASDIHLSVGADGLYSDEFCEYRYTSIEGGSSRSETIGFRFPRTLSGNMSVFANVTWGDGTGCSGARETITIEPPLKITKSTTGTGNLNATFYTTIGVTNKQTRKIHAVLADVLPMGFTLVDGSVTDSDHELLWEFELDQGEKRTYSYQSVTTRPAVYRVPTPHIKCNLGGLEYTATPGYSTTITVLQCQLDNEHRRNSTSEPTAAPTETPNTSDPSGSPQVNLSVYVLAAVSLDVTPASLDFGMLAPGRTSSRQTIIFNNRCNRNLQITADVRDTGDDLFVDGIMLNDSKWDRFDIVLAAKNESDVSTGLNVPHDYTGIGNKDGTIIFWAEA